MCRNALQLNEARHGRACLDMLVRKGTVPVSLVSTLPQCARMLTSITSTAEPECRAVRGWAYGIRYRASAQALRRRRPKSTIGKNADVACKHRW